jgi:hypothetical protein
MLNGGQGPGGTDDKQMHGPVQNAAGFDKRLQFRGDIPDIRTGVQIRTFSAMSAIENGFWINATPSSSTP